MKRPVGITILAVFAIVYGIFNLLLVLLGLIGIGLAASGVTAAARQVDAGTLAYAAIWDAILGVLYLVFGIGAFRLKSWAWITGVAALVLELVRNIIGYFINSALGALSIITSVIAILLLVYLLRPNVRAAFGKAARPPL